MSIQSSEACHYCGAPALYLLVYLDDAAGMPVCLDHMGHGYDHAERENAASFLPVHVSRIDTLAVAA